MDGRLVYVALGSNVAFGALEPRRVLEAALSRLAAEGCEPRRVSAFYETSPVGTPGLQPAFINAVAEVHCALHPYACLERLRRVEHAFGRERSSKNAPRTLDLDLLLFGDLVLQTAELTVPHPRMHERRFVLQPLVDLAPLLRHPVLRRTAAELLGALPLAGENGPDAVRRLDSSDASECSTWNTLARP